MLILTRNPGQSIMVGDDVTITVLSVRGLQVRLGVAAPRRIGVHREEVFKRVHAAKNAELEQMLTIETVDAYWQIHDGSR